jgi:hypothetical protein
MESYSKWMGNDKRDAPPSSAKSRPSFTPTSRNARREGMISTDTVSKKPKLSPLDHRVDSLAQTPPPRTVKPVKKLAPIFLKNYGRKETAAPPARRIPTISQDSKEPSNFTSRYPDRKRKQILDESCVVSDDADDDVFEPTPKKKKARSNKY